MMIPQEQQIKIQKQQEEQKIDYSHITKHAYINKLFCWIQNGNVQQVIKFFQTFPHLLHQFSSPNNWNPFLYAVRYSQYRLIDYFAQKGLAKKSNSIVSGSTIVHTAVYSGDPAVLQYVIKKYANGTDGIGVNCQGESSALKIAMKANNPKMVQILAAKGSYYVFGDVYNNLTLKNSGQQANKYCTLLGKQIPHNMVVQQGIVRDCDIKKTLKYARIKSLCSLSMYSSRLNYHDQSNKDHKFHHLAKILNNEKYLNLLYRFAVNKGQSILQKNITNQGGQQIG